MRATAQFDQAMQRTVQGTGAEAEKGGCELANLTFRDARQDAEFYGYLMRAIATATALALVACIVMLFVDAGAAGVIVSGVATLAGGAGVFLVKGEHDQAKKDVKDAIDLVDKYCPKDEAAKLVGTA